MTSSPNPQNRLLMVIGILLLAALAVGIVFLKKAGGDDRTLRRHSSSADTSAAVARPDTTLDSGVMLPPVTDTVMSPLPDTLLGRDRRDPYEAGYEDGYAAGCDDGANQTPRAGYDESNSFSGRQERQDYVRGYREGYPKGLEDGRRGRQFGI
ncbi:MAG: hypothetical protein ACI3YC_08590 [Alloprevotella sp.]